MTGAQWVALMLLACAALYSVAVCGYLLNGRPGMAVAFAGYVLANIGLIWDALEGMP